MTKVTPFWKRNVYKRNSYFDNIIKVFFENRNSIFIIFWFIAFFSPPQLLKSFRTGNSRTSWWDKLWLKNSTFVSNTRLLNKINVGYHCPESWVQGVEWISRKFSILNGKYLKKKNHRVQYNSARGQFWPETEPEVSPVCWDTKHSVRSLLSVFFSWTYLWGRKRILPCDFCHTSSRKSNQFASKEQHFSGFPLIYDAIKIYLN